jgi:CheY-like chemotaxis protein
MPNTEPIVMLVEDEALVALAVSDLVEDMGLTLAGPFRTNAEADIYLADHYPMIAILDYTLGGSTASRTAQALRANDVPFIVLSGYSRDVTDDPQFTGVEWITKPFSELQLQGALATCLQRASLLHPHSR